MTVLEWLKKKTRYSFDVGNLEVIARDRDIDPDDDVYGQNVDKRLRELMEADIIFTAVLLSPSNTASLSQSHNGYQKTIGQEQDFYQNDKIKYAIGIYQKYKDEKADALLGVQRRIRFIPIEDVDQLKS